eukprot:CAMPEP_0185035806 /NCGR_PEP_ID=MMETSP1103-20130426/27822_1 /TAXON_ID=36769 /ORGANISM="Paraphysomonas bandaiensis, Strain Caron Lab Isolate" /LENGTH=327 /DNA_ID=CAMNT_0027573065 /DNA_START=22 /DNA_END=1005 /DNA_ORIENTATION=-
MNKTEMRAAMEEKRRRWMQDREVTLAREEVYSQTRKEMSQSSQHIATKVGSTSDHSHGAGMLTHDEMLLNKLTERIAVSIRDEVRKEISCGAGSSELREAMTSKLDQYLESELHTHTCKICFELMTSPDHTPMLLFPCGHTFCKACMEKQSNKSKTCPYCRQCITSMAVNQSLKDLIDQFALQRRKLNDTSVRVDDVFPNRKEAGVNSRNSSRYEARYRSCEMRHGILVNELEHEKTVALEKIVKRKRTIKNAEEHLRAERKVVTDKMALLQEELELIDKYLMEQETKMKDVEELEVETRQGIRLLETSIASIQGEMEKLRILADGN